MRAKSNVITKLR